MKISIVQLEKPFLELHRKLVSKHVKTVDSSFRVSLENRMSRGEVVPDEHFMVLNGMIRGYRGMDYEET